MAIHRFETATAPWRSQPPPATALDQWMDWASRMSRARGNNLADTTGLDVQTLETWHKRGWYELFHYRSPFALSFSTGALARARSTSPSASKGQSPIGQQPSQDAMDYSYTFPPLLHTLPAAEASPSAYLHLRNQPLTMFQNDNIVLQESMPVAEAGIRVDQQDDVQALMDALQGEPPRWSVWALMLNTHTASPAFIAPGSTSSPQSLTSPIESPWDDFLQSPALGDADSIPDVFTSPRMFDMVDSTFDGPSLFGDFDAAAYEPYLLAVDAASSGPNAACSEPDATDPFAYVDYLLRTKYWSEGALECIAYDSQCQQALRSLEGARAESMMRRLHWVSPNGVPLSVSFLTCVQWISARVVRDSDVLRLKVVSMLLKLSIASGILPKDLFIQGVNIGEDRDPWTSGGFADVFRGTFCGQQVAVKRLRIQNEDKKTVNPVCH
jgi:hypothetical protein